MPLFGRRSGKDQNPKEMQAVRHMAQLLPKCPVCGADADYEAHFGLLNSTVTCRSCQARWGSADPDFHKGGRPDRLMLIKPDGARRAKALKGKEYSLVFWQDVNVEAYDSSTDREVKRIVERIQSAFVNDADYAQLLEELKELGVNGLLEAIEMATGGAKPSEQQQAGSLLALGMLEDKRGEQALIRVLEDENAEMRVIAAYSLVEFHKTTGSYDAVSSLTDRLKNDRSALVRSRIAVFLAGIDGDERVIQALREAVHDTARPAVGESTASGSWVELLSKAARYKIPPSVGDQAKWALEELGHSTGHSYRKGVEALKAGQYDEAISRLRRAVEVSESDERIELCYKLLGNACLEKESYEQAIEWHRKAVEMQPEDAQAWVNLGVAYSSANRLDDAEECYQRALGIQPDYAKLHQSLGVLYLKTDEPERGISELEKAIELAPRLAAAHGNLAFAYAKTGQPERAQSSLAKARKLGYENWRTIRRMIRSLG